MPLPTKSSKPAFEGVKDSEDSEITSDNLWVGNLAPDVTDSDLMELFSRYGELDSVSSYSSRSYAFVHFKRGEDAKAAKSLLQGSVLCGNGIKIEYAKPAKPCRQLWVSGISPAVTREELEAELRKFGKIDDFKFFRDRNTACVEFLSLDDATRAMKIMNGKRVGGDQIRVDFLRSQSTKKDTLLDYGHFQGKGMGAVDPYTGQKRPLHSQPSVGKKGDDQPSNILWIGFPPSFQIDEQMLHNAMILFGEIENIRSFLSRHYAFVEFRSVDEARRAKEGLQGRLFNDPRITIMYSSSELASGKDYPGFYSGSKGPRPDVFLNEHQFGPLQMDALGHNRPMVANNFPGALPPGGIMGPNIPVRPFGPQGSLEPPISGPEFTEMGTVQKFQDGSSKSPMGPNWKRPSPPATGVLPSPVRGIRPTRSISGAWDVLDINKFQRDNKRSRIDGTLPIDNAPFPVRNIDDHGLSLEPRYAVDPIIDGGGSGPFLNIQGKNHLGPMVTRVTAGRPGPVQPDIDYIWRGIIAKGGTHVCNARCVPVGKGIETELPEVVDCSARTGLDMLTKHYADAIGFDIVFFLPDSEDDFASYTEFLRYLSAKNRAGVAKLVDNTTLFLVPPSDFLTTVLKVTGPERLYGVVLKFPPVSTSAAMHQPSHLPVSSTQYVQQIPPPQAEYGWIPGKEEQVLPMDYSSVLHEDSKPPPKPLYQATSAPSLVQSLPPDYAPSKAASASLGGVTLTPELFATLASLLPGTTQSSSADAANSAAGSLTAKPPFPPVAPNDGNQSHLWKQDHQTADPPNHPAQQFGSIHNIYSAHYQPYPPASTPGQPAQMVPSSSHFLDPAASLQQQGAVSSRPMTSFTIPSQGGQVAISPQVSQQYHVEVSPSTQKGYGVVQGADASVLYSSQAFQLPINSISSSNQVHVANPSYQQTITPYAADKVNSEPPNQQLQSAMFGVGQGTSEVEADKNQRYQSTLQFAANLLLQIQQKQQQTQGGHGPGNQQ